MPFLASFLLFTACETPEEPQEVGCLATEFLDETTGACLPWVPDDYAGPTDPYGYMGPWQIAEVTATCAGADYAFDIVTDGWAGSLILDVIASGDWDGTSAIADLPRETHAMLNIDYAEDETWDHWGLTLTSSTYTSGTRTAFDCAVDDDTRLTWRADMLDGQESRMDCAIWGEAALQVWNDGLGDACSCIDC